MSARAGWYTDPNGEKGQYRYWDGVRWTAYTGTDPHGATPDPTSTPEHHGAAGPVDGDSDPELDESLTAPTRPGVPSHPSRQDLDSAHASNLPHARAPFGGVARPGWTRRNWLVGSLVVLAALLVAGALTFASRPGGGTDEAGPAPNGSASDSRPTYPTPVPPGDATTPHAQICDAPTARPGPTQQPDDQLVAAGGLAFPRLPEPWSQVTAENMSMATDSARQEVAFDNSTSAAVRVSAIDAGKHNSDPQAAADLAAACIMRTMYRYTMPASRRVRDEGFRVGEREGWLREYVLDVAPAGAEQAEEDDKLIVVTVQVAPGQMAMFNATVPSGQPAYLDDAREALNDLQVVA